jgi:molybdopterin-guanine dinucleotide biosynthesis protein MobB
MVLIVAAVGQSGSGKTVTIEYLIRQFSAEGYKVGAIKHVHHRGFTIDTEGKNTWRYAQAGAKVVVAMSPDEVAVIKKTSQETDNLEQIIESLEKESLDILFIEGCRDIVSKRGDMLKILTDKEDGACLQELLEKTVEPILAVSGLIAINPEKKSKTQRYPFIRIPDEGKQLVDLIKQYQMVKSKKEHEAA